MIDRNELNAFAATIRATEDSRFAVDPFDGSDDFDEMLEGDGRDTLALVYEPLSAFVETQGEPTHSWTHDGCTVKAWLGRRSAKRSIELRVAEFGDHLLVHQSRL